MNPGHIARIEAWMRAAQDGAGERSFAVDLDDRHGTFKATAYVEGAVFATGGAMHADDALSWLAFRLDGMHKPQQGEVTS